MSTRRSVLATRESLSRARTIRKAHASHMRPADLVKVAAALTVATKHAVTAVDTIARPLTFDGLIAGLQQDCLEIVDRSGKRRQRLHSQPWYASQILEAIGSARAAIGREDAAS